MFLFLFLPLSGVAQQVAPFRSGDRVAFVGNSITDGGHYHSYIWLYYMTRFPEMRMQMFNCGVGGDTALEYCVVSTTTCSPRSRPCSH